MKQNILRIVMCLCFILEDIGCFNSSPFIESLIKQEKKWKARRNFPEDTPRKHFASLAGSRLKTISEEKGELVTYNVSNYLIPKSFDARTEWPECPSIKIIGDQGYCASCWAISAASAISDRICIFSNGTLDVQLSPEDLIECCYQCFDFWSTDGCNGGYAIEAWNYWVEYGVVSGGYYKSHSGCKPYKRRTFLDGIAPNCKRRCRNSKDYKKDKIFGSLSYQVAPKVEYIQIEIMTNGPVQAFLEIYEDFYHYDSGVYHHVNGSYISGHSVKLIGWGAEDSVPYWLAANTWGPDWGTLGGFFKILRGVNHLKIESQIVAGIPLLYS